MVKDPGTPTAAERAAHEVTHIPYRAWCNACARGRAIGQQHRTLTGEAGQSSVTRVCMDYGFMKEEETVTSGEHETGTSAKMIMTILVMIETLCGSVWPYAIENKGAASSDWLAAKMVEDLNTVGLSKDRIITKADQEPAIVQLQHDVAKCREGNGTAIENSRVGDSDSNGRVERAIREVKGMVRTLRSHIEEKTGTTIHLDSPIVPWLVRHAGYLITRCKVRSDGKTAMQKMNGRRTNTPLLPCGESVLFKLPKVQDMPGDFRDRFDQGVWLGCTIRSGEHVVGTKNGVHTVSAVMRRAQDERWSAEAVQQIKGTPKEPVPGSGSGRMKAYSKIRDSAEGKAPEPSPRRSWEDEPEVRVWHIFKKDVIKFGQTPGCPGCRALMSSGSRYRAKHTNECRARIEEELKKSDEGQARVKRSDERINHAIGAKGE